jgi:DNA topoisomerase II
MFRGLRFAKRVQAPTTWLRVTQHRVFAAAARAPRAKPAVPTDDHSEIEKTYQKKSPIAHVLMRPGMYIGSTQLQPHDDVWWFDAAAGQMRRSQLSFNPGLVKLFDEVLVNAADNKVRDPAMRRLDVTVLSDKTGLRVTVENDGRGIPVVLHPTEGIYVPELVLGHLLTGSNFDPVASSTSSRKVTSAAALEAAAQSSTAGGRHGYGAKLTNIFSSEFSVETVDSRSGKRYCQTWKGNMSSVSKPDITQVEVGTADFTRVSFCPDLSRFYAGDAPYAVDAGTLAIMRRRVIDTAGLLAGSGVRVSFNGQPVQLNSFLDYARLYTPALPPVQSSDVAGSEDASADPTRSSSLGLLPSMAAKLRSLVSPILDVAIPENRRWDVVVGVAGLNSKDDHAAAASGATEGRPAQDVSAVSSGDLDASLSAGNTPGVVSSFVNGMSTPSGGSHAALVLDLLARRLTPVLHKRVAALPLPDGMTATAVSTAVTPAVVRAHLRLWVHARVSGPSFDSQSKERLVTPPKDLLHQLATLHTATVKADGKLPSDPNEALETAAALALGFTDRFLRLLVQECGIAEAIAATLRSRAEVELARSLRKAVRALPASQVGDV